MDHLTPAESYSYGSSRHTREKQRNHWIAKNSAPIDGIHKNKIRFPNYVQ